MAKAATPGAKGSRKGGLQVVGGTEVTPRASRSSKKGETGPPKEPEKAADTTPPPAATKGPAQTSPPAGHNSDSADREAKALFFVHLKDYRKALAAKKAAASEFLRVTKQIKSEGTSINLIKAAVDLDTPEGFAAFKLVMEENLRLARWYSLPVNTQDDLFDIDRRPLDERAYDEGERAGMNGEFARIPDIYPPDSPAGQAWLRGWQVGQQAIFAIKKPDAAPLIRKDAQPSSDERAIDAAIAGGDVPDDESDDDGDGSDDDAEGDSTPPVEEDWSEDIRPDHLRNGDAEV